MNDPVEKMNDAILDVTHLELTLTHSDLVDTFKQPANGKPVILHQNGEQVAALISIEALHLFERLIEEKEDYIDIADAQKILVEVKEQGTTPWEDIKAKLGL